MGPETSYTLYSHALELFKAARDMNQGNNDEIDWYPMVRKALSGVPGIEPDNDSVR